VIEFRDEPPDGSAAQALWTEYQALVRERLGDDFVATDAIFATEQVFLEPRAVWLVLYEDGRPVACGGVRPLDASTAEIKRMFVTSDARCRGHGRALLAELELRAAAAGIRRARLYTTEVLIEARQLYNDAGYQVVDAPRSDRRQDYWLERQL